MLRKRYQLNWTFECPDAVLTCSILNCNDTNYYVFGGHDKTLYLMDESNNIIDDRVFDGWVRCSYPIDLDGDGCDEILVGAGDGNFMVLKLNIEKKKLVGVMRYRSSKKIDCCTAGDFTRNGNIELIFGSEDKTLKIFDDIKAKEPKYILYYDSWVTACCLGILKLRDNKLPIYGLLVGTKNGLVQLIQYGEQMPDIVWQHNFNVQINDIKIGDVSNDGFNEILLSTDDATIKILNSEGEIVSEINTEEGRPISLLIEDVDGDNAKEIVAGCADGNLKVFHNPSLNAHDYKLKWKSKVSASIKDVCSFSENNGNSLNIIFGGYDRTIRNVSDFEWGQKETLEIPEQVSLPEIRTGKDEQSFKALSKIKPVPTNIREHIFNILQKKGVLTDLAKELTELGYTQDEVRDELEVLKTQKSVVYEKITYPVWSVPGEEVPEEIPEGVMVEPVHEKKPKVKVQSMVVEEPVKTDKEKLHAALASEPKEAELEVKIGTGGSIEDMIVEYLIKKKIVVTKAQFVNEIKEIGFNQKDIEKSINDLKEQGKIQYSRSAPKGWSVT